MQMTLNPRAFVVHPKKVVINPLHKASLQHSNQLTAQQPNHPRRPSSKPSLFTLLS